MRHTRINRHADRWSTVKRSLIDIFVAAIVAGIFFAGMARTASAATKPRTAQRPNILFILSDDQGWMDMGYNGSKVLTPNLDRLAKAGVRLDANYVFPTCSPTRVALIAGRNPSRYHIWGPIAGSSQKALPPQTVTIADMLHSAGYYTAISGKWHLGLRPEVGPLQYGFDSTYGYLHGQIDPYEHLYKYGDRTWHRQDRLIDEEGHVTDLLTKEAIRVIQRKSDQPFFLYVPYNVPHFPLQEPPEWLAMYEDRIQNPDRKLYAASLTHMDDGIGQIIAALDQTGKRNSTLIIYSSDNGGQESWGSPKSEYRGKFPPARVQGNNLPLRDWKSHLFEGGIRVPAMVNWPGHLKPGVVAAPVSILDWYPTFAHLIGVEINPSLKLEGRNIWSALTGKPSSDLSQRILYWNTKREAAVRIGPWKLIRHLRNGNSAPQLYNVIDDPYEKTDLASSRPKKVEELSQELKRQMQQDH